MRIEAGFSSPGVTTSWTPHSHIRPTHVDKLGYRWELPAEPELEREYKVSFFRPSATQRVLQCDGCSRSHQPSQVQCWANRASVGSEARDYEGPIVERKNEVRVPSDIPLGSAYIFHAMSHEKAGRYIGKLLEVDIIGKAKAGVAKVKFTRLGV